MQELQKPWHRQTQAPTNTPKPQNMFSLILVSRHGENMCILPNKSSILMGAWWEDMIKQPSFGHTKCEFDRFAAGLGALCGWKSLCGTAAPWSFLPERGPGNGNGVPGVKPGWSTRGWHMVTPVTPVTPVKSSLGGSFIWDSNDIPDPDYDIDGDIVGVTDSDSKYIIGVRIWVDDSDLTARSEVTGMTNFNVW